jgi:hypothetical protein
MRMRAMLGGGAFTSQPPHDCDGQRVYFARRVGRAAWEVRAMLTAGHSRLEDLVGSSTADVSSMREAILRRSPHSPCTHTHTHARARAVSRAAWYPAPA